MTVDNTLTDIELQQVEQKLLDACRWAEDKGLKIAQRWGIDIDRDNQVYRLVRGIDCCCPNGALLACSRTISTTDGMLPTREAARLLGVPVSFVNGFLNGFDYGSLCSNEIQSQGGQGFELGLKFRKRFITDLTP